jgi:hypothetical protein
MTTAIERWMRRTGGDEPPNAEERLDMIRERAERRNSFTAEDMLWVLSQIPQSP